MATKRKLVGCGLVAFGLVGAPLVRAAEAQTTTTTTTTPATYSCSIPSTALSGANTSGTGSFDGKGVTVTSGGSFSIASTALTYAGTGGSCTTVPAKVAGYAQIKFGGHPAYAPATCGGGSGSQAEGVASQLHFSRVQSPASSQFLQIYATMVVSRGCLGYSSWSPATVVREWGIETEGGKIVGGTLSGVEDTLNVVYTWDRTTGSLKFARDGGTVRSELYSGTGWGSVNAVSLVGQQPYSWTRPVGVLSDSKSGFSSWVDVAGKQVLVGGVAWTGDPLTAMTGGSGSSGSGGSGGVDMSGSTQEECSGTSFGWSPLTWVPALLDGAFCRAKELAEWLFVPETSFATTMSAKWAEKSDELPFSAINAAANLVDVPINFVAGDAEDFCVAGNVNEAIPIVGNGTVCPFEGISESTGPNGVIRGFMQVPFICIMAGLWLGVMRILWGLM